MHDGTSEIAHHATSSRLGSVTAELEETKQSLQKAQEESLAMATCLSSLQEELQRTKEELQHLKEGEYYSSEKRRQHEVIMDYLDEIEDVKFVEDYSKINDDEQELVQVKTETTISEQKVEFQKKRYVTFADPPSLAQVVVAAPPSDAVLQRHPSLRKSKKKPLPFIPLVKGIFRKRGSSGVEPAREAN